MKLLKHAVLFCCYNDKLAIVSCVVIYTVAISVGIGGAGEF